MDVKELQAQRNKIFKDYFHNIVPERMPVQMALNSQILAERAGISVMELQYDFSKLAGAVENMDQIVYSDTAPVGPVAGGASRIPGYYQQLDSQSFKMAANGQMQHPEVVGMMEDEYDDLIADPYACILEKVLPRQHHALSLDHPIKRAMSIDYVKAETQRQFSKSFGVTSKLAPTYGYYSGAPAGSGGGTAAPFDYLADQLRSFSGICKDMRRRPEQVKDACKALLPLMFSIGKAAKPDPEGAVMMFLHMPTFLRPKDFEDAWLPTFLEMIQQFAARGSRSRMFLEDNWMKYIDVLQDFPAGMVLNFEKGDPKLIKEKLGDKFLITGLFPLFDMKIKSKEEIIDQAKELLDIMLPGCGYIFGFDKNILQLSDINLDNMKALSEYLRDNAKYDHVGESFGTPINAEGYTIDEHVGDYDSKYKFNWAEYKEKNPFTPDFVKQFIEADELAQLRWYMNLLV